MSDLTLNVSRTISAPIESVYNAWLNPELLAQFMHPAANMHIAKAETDPRVGGRFTIVMATAERELPHGGEYKELTPYSKIVFSWESSFAADGSTVTIELKSVASGTHIELTHVKFLDEETRSSHEGGWTRIIETLSTILEPTDR